MAGQFVAFLASACMYLAAHIKAEPAKRTEALRHNLSTTMYISLNQVFVFLMTRFTRICTPWVDVPCTNAHGNTAKLVGIIGHQEGITQP